MGPLIAALWLWCGLALAAPELRLVAPAGDPLPGQEVTLWVLVTEDGAGLPDAKPSLEADRGLVRGLEPTETPGLWRTRYRAPDQPGVATFTASANDARVRTSLSVAQPRVATLNAPAQLVAAAGGEPVEILLTGQDLPDPADLQRAAGEGSFVSVDLTEAGLRVRWQPTADPFPRAVPLGFRDGRSPGTPPIWTVVSLRGRPRIPVQTQPGAKVTVRVGGRSYGPFVAGADGVAAASVEVRPGETTAEVMVTDGAGNQQKSTLTLGSGRSPALLMLAEAAPVSRRPVPALHLFAIGPTGEPWTGASPVCRSSLGGAQLTPAGPGRWRLETQQPNDPLFVDLAVDCELGLQAHARTRLSVEQGQPEQIVLRVWPVELTAELPVATVSAFLADGLGDRVASSEIALRAERGELVLTSGQTGLRADYNGQAAIGAVDDIVASWTLPPGKGGAWALGLSAPASTEGPLQISGRALDRLGRPLAGVALRLAVEEAGAEVVTDARGWATASLPRPEGAGPFLLEARSGTLVRRELLFAGSRLGQDPSDPDLVARVRLPVRAGRVAQAAVTVEPRVLTAVRGARTHVIVHLLDRDGNNVNDESIALTATSGEISPPTQRPDGSWEATWSAPTAPQAGEVLISVARAGSDPTSSNFSATTTLEIRPRPLRGAVGGSAGYLLGPRGVSSPWFEIAGDLRLPVAALPVMARVGVGTYAAHAIGTDPSTTEEIALDMRLIPMSVGLVARGDRARASGEAGAAVVMSPYGLSAQFGQDAPVTGSGLPSPGLSLMTGVSWRLRGAELEFQARYLLLSLDESSFGWHGSVGGLVATLGYKLLY